MTNTAETPNIDPTSPEQQVLLTPYQYQYLVDFTDGLRNALRNTYNGEPLTQEDDEYYQSSVFNIVQDAVGNALQETGPGAETLQLALTAEGLGATVDGTYANGLIDVLNHNDLLDQSEKNHLIDLTSSRIAGRHSGVSDSEIAQSMDWRIRSELEQIARGEQNDTRRDAYKIASLAFLAGVMSRVSSSEAAEELTLTAQGYVADPAQS